MADDLLDDLGLPQVISVAEAAKRLKINRATAYQWIDSGRLPVVRVANRMFVRVDTLDEIQQGTTR
jgi:excisionase family DNA binding protein